MAIVIEEENKGNSRLFSFGLFFIILIIIGVAVYYLFFKNPQLLDVVAPVKLQSIDELAAISKFDPKKVLDSSFYKSLKQVIPYPSPPPAGNGSPFGVF